MKIEDLYDLYIQHYKVDTDTRKIRNNSIYFALKGENFNGNIFAQNALEKGALYAVVDEEKYAVNDRTILVENTLQTLQELARYHRSHITYPILALTGSNGKTTTKELIYAVLKQKFNARATAGNLNNHIGVPLTILSFDPSTEFGIVEMGANHQKEIEFLSEIAAPDYGYITNFGKAHLEGFGGIEGVIKGKSELYQYLRANNKKVFVNPEDAKQVELTQDLEPLFFDRRAQLIASQPFLEISLGTLSIHTNLIGIYNYNNVLAALTIGKYFNINDEEIKVAIESYLPKNNRSQIIDTGKNRIVLDAYNANPTSMEAALRSFSSMKEPHKIVILGDMFELGKEAIVEHQKIAELAAALHFEHLFLVGENFSGVQGNFVKYASTDQAIEAVKDMTIDKALILIKGSRGMALEKIVPHIN